MPSSRPGESARTTPDASATSRKGSGLHNKVSQAITEAAFAELANAGYAGLSMEGVARRAHVGKAALYRRWHSKREMVGELIRTRIDATLLRAPDTESLLGDLTALLTELGHELWHPQVLAIAPDLLAAAHRDAELDATLKHVVMRPRREAASDVLAAAITRGELPTSLHMDLAIDLIVAPPTFRALVTEQQRETGYTERLAAALAAALPQLG